ncbi:MAG: hypothetical protein JKX85_08370 [Phycisphaeraceae bacterium]|nr:hypothetical protein [Phycisphaeraceae bacterium]
MNSQLKFYLKLPSWTYDQARYLLADCDPDKSNDNNVLGPTKFMRLGAKAQLINPSDLVSIVDQMKKFEIVIDTFDKPLKSLAPLDWFNIAVKHDLTPPWFNDAPSWFLENKELESTASCKPPAISNKKSENKKITVINCLVNYILDGISESPNQDAELLIKTLHDKGVETPFSQSTLMKYLKEHRERTG